MSEYSRKMGKAEELATKFHEEMNGVCSVACVAKVRGDIDFKLFQEACHIVFLRHPLLRATCQLQGNDYFFEGNALFANIPIRLVESKSDSSWKQEYGNNILAQFNLARHCWRASLIKVSGSESCHIALSAIHSICDGKSLACLMGELLEIIVDLKKSCIVHALSMELPPALDDIIDPNRLPPRKEKKEWKAETLPWKLDLAYDPKKHRNENFFVSINAISLKKLLHNCRKYRVTFTQALIAAFAQSLFEMGRCQNGVFDFCVGFDLRKYTTELIGNNVLAFYVQPLFTYLELSSDLSFWDVALQAKTKLAKAMSEYQFPTADSHDLSQTLLSAWKTSIENKEAFMPHCISNIGKIDEAFSMLSGPLFVEEYFFTVNQHGIPHGLCIFCSTLNGVCHLDFNFALPGMNPEWVMTLSRKLLSKLN